MSILPGLKGFMNIIIVIQNSSKPSPCEQTKIMNKEIMPIVVCVLLLNRYRISIILWIKIRLFQSFQSKTPYDRFRLLQITFITCVRTQVVTLKAVPISNWLFLYLYFSHDPIKLFNPSRNTS